MNRLIRPKRFRAGAYELMVVLGIVALIVLIISPSYVRWRDEREARADTRNLSRVGMGTLLYANDHAGKLPRTIAEMVGPYFGQMPVCPRAQRLGLSPPDGGPAGGFVYLRAAERLDAVPSPATTVMAYEPLVYHDNVGMDVLFYDGHCVWIQQRDAEKMLRELAAGRNPPKMQLP
jgi:hypothetical protein